MAVATHWRVPPNANLSWRRWPGEHEYLFYHGASGDTHRVSELAGLLMEEILAGNGTTTDALRHWLTEMGLDAADTTLDALLDGLSSLDLIEPASADR